MRIGEVCPVVGWPPTAWTCSFEGLDRVVPDLARATIDEARAGARGVQLSIVDDKQRFRTTLPIEDRDLRHRVAEVLSDAKGATLEAAGGLVL